MQIPQRSENIYPTTEENIKHALLYYFPNMPHTTINEQSKLIYERRGLTLNQVEFVAKMVSENVDFLKGVLYGRANNLDTIIQHGSEALYGLPGYGSEKDKANYQSFREHLENKYQ